VEQVDFEERLIFVRRGKGGKDRIVFLEPETAKFLKAYLGDRTSGRVFPVQPRRVQRIVKRMAQLAGVRNANLITPHKLRHSFAINWVQHGGDIESLRRLLGHNSLSTTQIYLNFDFAYVRQVYDRLYAKPDERRLFS
jgi:site-specific recombinase XerD